MSDQRTARGRTGTSGRSTGRGRPQGTGRPTSRPQGSPRPQASADVFRRRRLLVGGLALAVVLLVVLLTAFVWPGFARDEPEAKPAGVTAAPPSPTIAPTGRPEDQTAFLAALPDTTLQLAVQKVEEAPSWVDDDGAVEAWALTYADAAGEGAATVRVVAGQWEDTDAATSAFDALLKEAGDPTSTGDVTVDGKGTGTYAVTPGAEEGQSVVTWRNGTAVFSATGPTALVQDFYSAYPL